VPLELPGGAAEPSETDLEALGRITRARLGRAARFVSGRWTYGPSRAHAIDRRAADAGDGPSPLLQLERAAPADGRAGSGLRPVVIRAYLAQLGAVSGREMAGAVWLGLEALRAAVRGMPLRDLLGQDDVAWEGRNEIPAPQDALVYVPSEYGERYLLRAIAKYGQRAVLGEQPADGPG
jgi:hypothetical protein